MCQCAQLEVSINETIKAFDEGLPHKTACRVIREGEVDGSVEELLELYLGAFVRLTRAADDRDSCLISNPLRSPLLESTFDPVWILHIILLLSTSRLPALALRLLRCPDLLGLVDVDEGWGVLLGSCHYQSDHLLTIFSVTVVNALDAGRAQIEDNRASLCGDCPHY